VKHLLPLWQRQSRHLFYRRKRSRSSAALVVDQQQKGIIGIYHP
jgi:hypothetical protein